MAWGGPDGQLAQIREQSKDSDKLALTDEVNGLIEGLKIGLGWLSDRDKEIATDNPDILGDDLYRLARGGLRNTLGAVNFLSDVAIKSSEGKLNDPIGAASIVGHGLRLADFATKKSGEIGGAIAEHGFGVDPRVGQAIGSFAPDLLLSRGAGTLSKLSKGLRIGTPTGRAFAIAGGYGGVPAATMMNIPDLGRPLQMAAKTSAATKAIDATTGYNPRRNALTEYKQLLEDGFDMSGDKDIQRLLAQTLENSADKLPTNVKQWDNKALYIKATKDHIAKHGVAAGKTMRESVGVFVDPKTKEIFQVMKRGNKNLPSDWQLRRGSEATNTNLNRALDTFLQSPGYESYKSIANKELMMKQIGFKGTKQEFQKLFEIHHVNAIKVYSPFFTGLKPKQAAELRKLAEGAKIYLGNDPRNLVPLLKRKHTLDKDSIHTFMRENGIEGSRKWPFLSTEGNKLGSYNPQARMAALLEGRSVQERFEVLKGFQEWVQKPATTHLDELLTAKQDLENLVINA